jgi:methionine-S-sulfoxide reductase
MRSFPGVLFAAVVGCGGASSSSGGVDPMAPAPLPAVGPGQAEAVFAGGCFWCMESDFDKLAGVASTTSGYAGGHLERPTYEQVGGRKTGHLEAVRVVFDPARVTYAALVDYFFRHVDPTDPGGQFCDRGPEYATGIFPRDAEQARVASEVKAGLEASGKLGAPIVTAIYPVATVFWPAENYHQGYHESNPGRYYSYRLGCGRDTAVARLWGGR